MNEIDKRLYLTLKYFSSLKRGPPKDKEIIETTLKTLLTNNLVGQNDTKNWVLTEKGLNALRELENQKLSETQVEILQKQSLFNGILAIVGVILASAAFLEIILYISENGIKLTNAPWYLNLGFTISILIMVMFMGGLLSAIVLLIFGKIKKRN